MFLNILPPLPIDVFLYIVQSKSNYVKKRANDTRLMSIVFNEDSIFNV